MKENRGKVFVMLFISISSGNTDKPPEPCCSPLLGLSSNSNPSAVFSFCRERDFWCFWGKRFFVLFNVNFAVSVQEDRILLANKKPLKAEVLSTP